MDKVGIILTTTVNVQPKAYLYQTASNERLQCYLKSIDAWLQHTPFKIIVIENTGYSFPETETMTKYKDRFEIISFVEETEESAFYLKGNPHKGSSEMFSIQYAYCHSNLLHTCDFIVKITGRYFVPEFVETMQKMQPLDAWDGLRQNTCDRCEIVGCSRRKFPFLFNAFLLNKEGKYDGHVENIYKWRMTQLNKVFICPVFTIEPTQMGGINYITTQL